MGKFKLYIIYLFCVFLILVGCSDVSFRESDPDAQIARSGTYYSQTLKQGVITQKLDVLVVVDNSGSMSEDQQKMGEKIDSFLNTLSGIDWQLGITTSDVSDGPYGLKGDLLTFSGTSTRILTPKTNSYSQIFLNTIVRPEVGSGDEQALRAAIMAIEKRDGINRGFFREGADLGLLVLSDEDEKSAGTSDATKPAEVLNYFNSVWGEEKNLFTYGMVIVPGDSACLSAQGGTGKYGDFVAELSQLTGGLVGSICEPDYAPTLGLLAEHAKKLLDYVPIKYYPVPETVEVRFNPSHTTTYRVQGRRIYFDVPPPKDTEIFIGYIVK